MISYDDFKKLDLRIAKIIQASRIENSDKLIKLQISLGQEERQIVAGIGKHYQPEELMGKLIVVVSNLEPRKLLGQESNGMLLAASNEDELALLIPDKDINPGAIVK
jgi:methionine--tRNA ligase beta chain